MGHSTASGRPQAEAAVVATSAENATEAPAKKKITKKDFDIVWEWERGRLQGQENYGYYIVRTKKTGHRFRHHFSSKRAASAWLGKQIKIANEIRSGRIAVERDENGRITGGHRVRG